ncbi:MAG: hypothetical protein K2X47_15520 [Bdellovibrionales bacterium]|nr:hypothetical protein [Bdellovibrionales bacterium]
MNLKSLKSTTVLISSLIALLTACGAKKQQTVTEETYDQDAFMIENAVNSFGSMADDASGQTAMGVASAEQLSAQSMKALSGTCSGVAAFAACQQGARKASYDGCAVPFSNGMTALGSVDLNYSDVSCSMANVGDQVNRTFDMTYQKNGFKVLVSSAAKADYRGGSAYGGGGKLIRTNAGWTAEQSGRHTKLIGPAGVTRLDISVKTLQPVQITGSLSRESRVINSGEIEVNHNLAEKSVVFSFNNLTYSQQCCYPVSGSLSRSGDYGSGTVEFLSCGQVRITSSEGVREIPLKACE